MLLEPGAV